MILIHGPKTGTPKTGAGSFWVIPGLVLVMRITGMVFALTGC